MHAPAWLGRARESLVICLLNLLAWGLIAHAWRDPRLGAVRIEPAPTATTGPTATPVRLVVYVSGAVATPGIVRLPEGARAADAVGAAGGFAATADRAAINLAAALADGEQLNVPETGASAGATAFGMGGSAQGSGMSASGIPGGRAAPIGRPSRAAETGASGRAAASGFSGAVTGGEAAGQAVNVNLAGTDELEALPGIGPALAARIIAHRQAHGPFQTVDDLLRVSGIGPKTLERFKARVATK